MAKKEKTPLTPEQIAEKKLNKKKTAARVIAIVLAIAITACVYVVGSLGGPKTEKVEPQAVQVEKVVTQTVTVPAPTEAPTEAPTAAPTEAPTEAPTAAPTEAPTTAAPSGGSDSGDTDILGTITGLLGGVTDGLGDFDIGSLLGGGSGIDTSGAADAIEGIGNSAQDFFNGIADKVGGTEA